MRLIHADALIALADIPDASIDMVFTDPPYGHNNNGNLISRREQALGVAEHEQERRPKAHQGAVPHFRTDGAREVLTTTRDSSMMHVRV